MHKKKYREIQEIEQIANEQEKVEQEKEQAVEIRNKIVPETKNQQKYFNAIDKSVITIVDGCSGTGKTLIAVYLAVRGLIDKKFDKIVVTRPIVECSGGNKIGFLPGLLVEKIHPYLRPVLEYLEHFLTPKKLKDYIEKGVIDLVPVELMRGLSLHKSFIIGDEFQNTTKAQIELFLTRIGNNSKMVICGDSSQKDLPESSIDWLSLRLDGMDQVSVVELDESDILRNPLIREILKRLHGKDQVPSYGKRR